MIQGDIVRELVSAWQIPLKSCPESISMLCPLVPFVRCQYPPLGGHIFLANVLSGKSRRRPIFHPDTDNPEAAPEVLTEVTPYIKCR